MGIVRFALRFPHTFYVVAALILFLGSVACIKMPTDIFPEINIPVVTVIWSYTGLSTPEMEQRVTLQPVLDQRKRQRHQEHRSADHGRSVGAEDLLPA
jgi:multidrug efflux pump subunit AcrB